MAALNAAEAHCDAFGRHGPGSFPQLKLKSPLQKRGYGVVTVLKVKLEVSKCEKGACSKLSTTKMGLLKMKLEVSCENGVTPTSKRGNNSKKARIFDSSHVSHFFWTGDRSGHPWKLLQAKAMIPRPKNPPKLKKRQANNVV